MFLLDIYVEVIYIRIFDRFDKFDKSFILMKQFRIVSLSSKAQFIVQDNTGINF